MIKVERTGHTIAQGGSGITCLSWHGPGSSMKIRRTGLFKLDPLMTVHCNIDGMDTYLFLTICMGMPSKLISLIRQQT